MPNPGDSAQEHVLLAWPARVKVLANRTLWATSALAFGAGSLLVGLIFLLAAGAVEGVLLALGLFVGFMALFAIIGAVIDLFGGFTVTFVLTTEGVRSLAGAAPTVAAATATMAALAAQSMAAAGAGLGARTEKNVFLTYAEITKVTVRPGQHYVHLKGGFGDKPIGLYCTPENFDRVLATLRERCPAARPA